MAGIGEASAILAFVELGFSFASALAKYTEDYQKAATEIGGLPEKLQETVGLISDLQGLLEQNETTHCWTDAGVKRAHQNVRDCEQIVGTLQSLLMKAGIPPDKADITLQDLELSIVTKATWPLKYKPKVENAKEDLDKLYNRISVTILTYSVQTSKEKTSRAGLEKELARLLYLETKGHTKPKGKQRQDTQQGTALGRLISPSKTGMKNPRRRASDARSLSSTASGSDADERSRIEAICAALKDLARAELAREAEATQAEEKRMEAMRAQAVEDWQTNIKAQVEEQNRRRANLRQELSPRLESSAITEVLNSVFPPQAGLDQGSGKLVPAISDVPNASHRQHLSLTSPAQRQRKPMFGGLFTRKKARQPELDVELREMVSPAGRASLRGFVIAYDSERFVHSIPMGGPQEVFIERLMSRSEKTAKELEGEDTPWQEYAMLPAVFKSKIAKERKSLGVEWLLVHVERVFEPAPKKLFKRPPQQLRGVYVIFRYQKSAFQHGKDSKAEINQRQGDGDQAGSVASGSDAKEEVQVGNVYAPATYAGVPEPSFEQRIADALRGRSKSDRYPPPGGPTPYPSQSIYVNQQRHPSAPPLPAMAPAPYTDTRRNPSRGRYDTSPARPSRYPSYYRGPRGASPKVVIIERERPRRDSEAYRQGRTVDLDAVRPSSRQPERRSTSRNMTSLHQQRSRRNGQRYRTIRFEDLPPHDQQDIYEMTADNDYDGYYDEPRRGRQSNIRAYYPSRSLSMGPIHRSPSPIPSTSSREPKIKAPETRIIQRLKKEIKSLKDEQRVRKGRESDLAEAEERIAVERMELEAREAEAGMSTFGVPQAQVYSSPESQVKTATFAMEEPIIQEEMRRTSSPSTSSSAAPHPQPEARSYALTKPIFASSRFGNRRATSAASPEEDSASPEQVTQLLSELTTGPMRRNRAARYEAPAGPPEQAATGLGEHDVGGETSAKHTDKYRPPEVE